MSITVVGSPPYATETPRNDQDYAVEKLRQAQASGHAASRATWGHNAGSTGQQGYGTTTPGQLGALPSGALDAPTQPAHPVSVTTWQGCYSDGWQDLMVPEAFAHPAKFARGLIHRIYRHLIEQGYVRQGDVVLDPFGGVALGALDALTYGLRYMGVELEPRFVALGQQNLDLWRQRYGFTGGTIVQGDSRRLREVLAGAQVQAVVGSPPFAESLCTGRLSETMKAEMASRGHKPSASGEHAAYGDTTPGQLGAMPPGALVSSPPYAGAGEVLGTHNGIDWSKAQEGGTVATPARQASGEGYGTSAGQLGAMPPGVVVSSPPFGAVIGQQDRTFTMPHDTSGNINQDYGTSAGQLGAMPPGAVVSSPPYAQSHVTNIDTGRIGNTPQQPVWKQTSGDYYGPSPEQLGNTAGDTFWSASAQIMAELAALLPPGAVCAWVLKAYVSKKAIVPFPDQWRQLCEAHGFRLVEEIHASLVEDHGTQEGLFGDSTQVRTEKKSFFRRLAEKKGSPRIDHETVLIVRKDGSGGGMCCVSSPPFSVPGCQPPNMRAHAPVRQKWAVEPDRQDSYGTTPGNLGNLPVGVCCVSSPPYAAETMRNDQDFDTDKLAQARANASTASQARSRWGANLGAGSSGQLGYGTTPGNLGNLPVGRME